MEYRLILKSFYLIPLTSMYVVSLDMPFFACQNRTAGWPIGAGRGKVNDKYMNS